MLPSGRWALTPPFHPCQMRSTERGGPPVFPKACRRGASITGGLFSVALSVAALLQLAFAHLEANPLALPGALPFVAGSCEFAATGVRTFLRRPFARSSGFRPSRRSPGSPAILIISLDIFGVACDIRVISFARLDAKAHRTAEIVPLSANRGVVEPPDQVGCATRQSYSRFCRAHAGET